MNYEEHNKLFHELKPELLSITVNKEILIRMMKKKFGLNDLELRYIIGVFSKEILLDALDCLVGTEDKTEVLKILMMGKDKQTLAEPCFPRTSSYGLLQSRPKPVLFRFDSCRIHLRIWELSLSDSDEACEVVGLKPDIHLSLDPLLTFLILSSVPERLHSALRFLFGRGSNDIDPYKHTFGYRFHLLVEKNGKNSEYLMGLTDRKGNWDISYARVVKESNINRVFPTFHPPVPGEFTEEEMIRLSLGLLLFLEEYRKTSSLFKTNRRSGRRKKRKTRSRSRVSF